MAEAHWQPTASLMALLVTVHAPGAAANPIDFNPFAPHVEVKLGVEVLRDVFLSKA